MLYIYLLHVVLERAGSRVTMAFAGWDDAHNASLTLGFKPATGWNMAGPWDYLRQIRDTPHHDAAWIEQRRVGELSHWAKRHD